MKITRSRFLNPFVEPGRSNFLRSRPVHVGAAYLALCWT
jgi:hypothetical protein